MTTTVDQKIDEILAKLPPGYTAKMGSFRNDTDVTFSCIGKMLIATENMLSAFDADYIANYIMGLPNDR